MNTAEKRYHIADFSEIPGVACPCGLSRRAFIDESGGQVSLHVVDILEKATVHYHRNHLEIYYVLSGTGVLEADGEVIPLYPGQSVLIRENCRHRAVGTLQIVNVAIPAFDPEDECFD